ncbi:MAG TPA: cysteine hydrolase [Rhodospirillaceae bacterium]|nr:chloramphenicol resistance protein [Rhodospirillaceae bacterium]HAT35962.1 cysteine hydrolase [Rhodospirillaceae bacterium]
MTKSVLLIGDMMNDLVNEDGPSPYLDELKRRNTVGNNVTAIAKARAAGVPVGFIRVGFSTDYREVSPNSPLFTGAKKAGRFQLGEWGTEVHPDLAPQPEDFDIIKHRVSPFYGTRMEPLLRAQGIEHIYITGVSSSGVVLSTAKEGHDRDFIITIIEDCCCAGSEEDHQAVLHICERFANITTSGEVTFGG